MRPIITALYTWQLACSLKNNVGVILILLGWIIWKRRVRNDSNIPKFSNAAISFLDTVINFSIP